MQPPVPLQKSPPKPRNAAVLWLFATLSVSIVLGTVLLSNDMRNLKSLALRFGFDLDALRPVPPAEIKKTSPVRLSQAVLPPVLRAPAVVAHASDFFWVRQVAGPALCRRLSALGIAVSEWTETAFNSETFECVYENVERDEAGALLSSIFLVVRGDAVGTVTGIRVKLVSPRLDRSGQIDPQIMRIFEQVLDEPHWPDFSDALNAVKRLRDYQRDSGGVAFIFSQEPTKPGRFNLTLTPANSAGGPVRMMARRVLPGAGEGDVLAPLPREDATRMPFLNGWITRAADMKPGPIPPPITTDAPPPFRMGQWVLPRLSQRKLADNPEEAGSFIRSTNERPPLWQFTR